MIDEDKSKAQLIEELVALRQELAIHKRDKVAQHQAETKYQSLIEQLPAITYIVNIGEVNQTSYISPQVETLLGFTPQEWLADSELWIRQLHPDDRDRVLAEVEHKDTSGEKFDLEYRVIARDGRIVWFHNWYKHIVELGDPEQRHYVHGVMLDITERKQGEQQLRQQNQYLSTLHEMALGLMSWLEADELLTTLIIQAGQLLDSLHGFIYLADSDTSNLILTIGTGVFEQRLGERVKSGEGLVGQVWATSQSLVIDNYNSWADRDPHPDYDLIQTTVGIPLFQNRISQAATFEPEQVGVFGLAFAVGTIQTVDSEMIELLTRFADLASVALANAKLFKATTHIQQQAEARAKELATLNRITQTVASAQDLPTALGIVAREMVQLFDARNSGITLLNHDHTTLTVVADHSKDSTDESAVGIVIPVTGNPSSIKVIETGRSIVLEEAKTHPLTEPIHQILQERNTECLMIIPLLARGEVIGTIGVDTTEAGRVFATDEVELAETIAGQIAGAIDNARLFSEEQTQRKLAESLQEMVAVLNASLDQKTVLSRILVELRKLISYDSAAIFFQDGDDLVLTYGVSLAFVDIGFRIPLTDPNPSSQVFREQQPIIVDDVRQDPRWIVSSEVEKIQAWMGVPFFVGDKVIGVLTLDGFESGLYTEQDAQILQTIANHAAIAIENARLYAETQQAIEDLKATQSQLVETEKMAALGGLVAGIAHEINTPIGVGVTAASLLEEKTLSLRKLYDQDQMRCLDLEKYLDTAEQSSMMLLRNLNRAAELIQSFKQVAVDQTSEEKRQFRVKAYLEEVLLSLRPQLKRTKHSIEVKGDEQLTLHSYPGVFSQIITNLVMNSLLHAYEPDEAGRLTLYFEVSNSHFHLTYSDDGQGIAPDNLGQIFDPFFTTKRGHGGSGLGLHIIYNLITQKLAGIIRCESQVEQGTTFFIEVPLESEENNG